MLSRSQLQAHHNFGAHSYMPISITPRSHPPAYIEEPHLEQDNLQAGRKRKKSEVNSTVDERERSPVRRRISRACDQCNQLRTKCDGKHPCAHCLEIGVHCEYARVHKKRGRAPKRDQDSTREQRSSYDTPTNPDTEMLQQPQSSNRKYSNHSYPGSQGVPESTASNTASMSEQYELNPQNSVYPNFSDRHDMTVTATNGLPNGMMSNLGQPHFAMHHTAIMPSQSIESMPPQTSVQQGFGFPLGDDYSVAFMGKAPMVESPDWMALTTPMFSTEPVVHVQPRTTDTLRFPVLRPLLPHIEPIIPLTLACDLLEQYFTSSTSAYLRPSNPYILGYIFRKKSVLHPINPRPCTPALLASMLWIAAQTSDAMFLTAKLDARGKVCQRLLELTIAMLKPLIHNSAGMVVGTVSYTSVNQSDAALGGLVVPTDQTGTHSTERAQVDNIATYIHLATVVSASERKAASLRWWNAAWSLAREIRLGRELPDDLRTSESQHNTGRDEHSSIGNNSGPPSYNDSALTNDSFCGSICQEEREERRRAWWLLYMQDRHLALCYNRPMFFLNKECESLLQPLNDDVWQSDYFEESAPNKSRRQGLNIECNSHSVFGYFLPLMVILGEILDLNHARNRPRFGPMANRIRNWDETTEEITQQLEFFERSLREFQMINAQTVEDNHGDGMTPSIPSGNNGDSPLAISESGLQTKTVVAYATHIMHVLHVLLTGKWDPIALLDDNDLWISSQSFVTATGHAVSAAEAVGDVIDYDPDLSFMPFFFGVYLLQGSFLLLLFADKLQGDVSPDVVKACETIVRAHEACVATLDTQYQRNFRKVMRSALQQVRGRTREDPAEQQNWRREVLKLYRWTGDGTGLAL